MSRYIHDGLRARPDLNWRLLTREPLGSLSQAESTAAAHSGTTTIERTPVGYVVYVAGGA